jgi:hypothetical protein
MVRMGKLTRKDKCARKRMMWQNGLIEKRATTKDRKEPRTKGMRKGI